jgi:hypothetical protein
MAECEQEALFADVPAVPAGPTATKRAQVITTAYFGWYERQHGRPYLGLAYPAMLKLLVPFLAAGVADDELRRAMRTIHDRGAAFTRQGIEVALTRRDARRPEGTLTDIMAAAAEASRYYAERDE